MQSIPFSVSDITRSIGTIYGSNTSDTIATINATIADINTLLDQYNQKYSNYKTILANPPIGGDSTVNAYASSKDGAPYTALAAASPNPGDITIDSASQSAMTIYSAEITNGGNELNRLTTLINNKAINLTDLINQVTPVGAANRQLIASGAALLEKEIAKMNASKEALAVELLNKNNKHTYANAEIKSSLDVSSTSTASTFMRYMLYFFFAFFVVSCVCLLYIFPSNVYLDTFIIILGGGIVAYYAYDYFQM
jgi:hypothetical protein